jgi:tRNA1(Val) A37 N6-methylase TrmN6
MNEIVKILSVSFGAVDILLVLPKQDMPPKRVIIRAKKGGETVVKDCDPLVLHKPDGSYSETADNVLRHGVALQFTSE